MVLLGAILKKIGYSGEEAKMFSNGERNLRKTQGQTSAVLGMLNIWPNWCWVCQSLDTSGEKTLLLILTYTITK